MHMMCFPPLMYVDWFAADGWGRYLPFPLWVVDEHLLICNTSTIIHCLTNYIHPLPPPNPPPSLPSNFLAGFVGIQLSDRQKSFSNAPGIFCLLLAAWLFNLHVSYHSLSLPPSPQACTVMFLHWLSGMVFIFYFALIIVLLCEILHPGVLWFLRNLNAYNFHPINTRCEWVNQLHMY